MRRSHQRGWTVQRGKKWYGYFRKTLFDPTTKRQKTVRVTVVLGSILEMSKQTAREALAVELIRQTGHAYNGRVVNDDSVTFGWFVRNRFLPLKEANWSEETAKVKELIINRDLIATFDAMPLKNFDKFTLQLHLNKLARTRSKD